MNRTWQVAKKITADFRNQFPELHPIIVQLLHNRNLRTQETIDEFMNPDYGQDVHDPFLFREMRTAVDRIFLAIERKEKITVHGDYDADGVSATVIVVTTLKALGGEVDVYIPHRMLEGYGLSVKTVRELANNGTKLIITVDCGISSKPEIDLARELGLDVIITDHHEEPPQLPAAFATVNPSVKAETYPFRHLSGAGVAFKLVQALMRVVSAEKNNKFSLQDGFEKWLLDLVAIGTIGDCVPLIGENRTLVKYGLVVLRKTRRPGVRAIAENARIDLATLDTYNVSFAIVPRLNAAGRINHANTAYELLTTEDQAEGERIAGELEQTNRQRQKTTEQMVQASKVQIGAVKEQKILYAIGDMWSAGIVGLVAGRLSDEFSRPVLVMGQRDQEVIGSGRSIGAFDITAALIAAKDYLARFGGHAAACGFTLAKKNLKPFLAKMQDLADQQLKTADLVKKVVVDCELPLEQTSWELVELLESFEPFGEDNRRPTFMSANCLVVDVMRVGPSGKHLKFTVTAGGVTRKIIFFNAAERWANRLSSGDTVDIVHELSFNEWNGNRELQLKAIDLQLKK